ncbi:hypothetical protein BGX34_010413 [Mortierella sp. NVP85]|nr:hypothetical protein BGX34_010413 [Mortierella sp. NVP85]
MEEDKDGEGGDKKEEDTTIEGKHMEATIDSWRGLLENMQRLKKRLVIETPFDEQHGVNDDKAEF